MAEEKKPVETGESAIKPEDIHMPPNSYWPIVLALGFALIMYGVAANLAVVIFGAIMTLTAVIGWVIEPV